MSLSARVLGLVGLMTIGMTVDAEALPHEHDTAGIAVDSGIPKTDIQGPLSQVGVVALLARLEGEGNQQRGTPR